MSLITSTPGEPLVNFVELFWLYEHDTPTHSNERLLPTGTMELVIDLAESAPGALVNGAHSRSFDIDTSNRAVVLGVHFKPGGAFPFLGLPAGELHNLQVSLDTLWGRDAVGSLGNRVLEAKTPKDKFRVLEQMLIGQAKRSFRRHPAVDFALNEFHSATSMRTVADVVDEIGMSSRRFIQIFQGEVGMTPKLYRRVVRFQQLLQRIQGLERVDWATTAVDCGYYDQPHFIRDFRDLSGFSPTNYLRLRGEHLNHVPLMD